jgi:Ca-activated chloride channel family protein
MLRLLVLCLLSPFASAALAGERASLVLDASGSMWQRLEGRTKVEIARDAVDGLLADWNPEVALGMTPIAEAERLARNPCAPARAGPR